MTVICIKNVEPVTVEPVTLEEAKQHLRVTFDEEDQLILNLIAAAREYAEAFHGRHYITSEVTEVTSRIPNVFRLAKIATKGLVSVTVRDFDGNEHNLTDFYELDKSKAFLCLKTGSQLPAEVSQLYWNDPVEIIYLTGYEPTMKTKQAILLLVGHWYEHREAVLVGGGVGFNSATPIPLGVDALLQQERHTVL